MKEQVGQIRISKRIVHIGHQDYPLANISRVQTMQVIRGGKLATSYPAKRLVVLLMFVGVVAAASSALSSPRLPLNSSAEETAGSVIAVVMLIAAVRIAYLLGLLLYRLLLRRPLYALVIETAGSQYTALTGTDRDEIHWIRTSIVDAIEEPPTTEQILNVSGDVVLGDQIRGGVQYKQTGPASTMVG